MVCMCLGSGTPHKPSILGHGGHVVHEATACSRYLHGMHGVALDAMLKEVASYDTVNLLHAMRCVQCLAASLHLLYAKPYVKPDE